MRRVRSTFGLTPWLLLLALTLVLTSLPAMAQSTYGSISGLVTDPSGAVIVNAEVEVTNKATAFTRKTTTDSEGLYRVMNLEAGTYDIKVTAPGFLTSVRTDFPLLARELGRQDVQLHVSSAAAESVEVRADAITTEGVTISDSKSGVDINSLALNFRATNNTSPIVVANLAPGVQPDRLGNISISGNLPNVTSFSLDGISTQSVRNGGPNKDLFPSVESIGEFKVNAAGSNAEFAQPTDITVTSKSGGNDYHGSIFWFHQNAALNSKDTFQTRKAPLVANDFGVSLGGPLSIPHLYNARNHTFFFFTYEGTRRPEATPLSYATAPIPWRNGDLSAVLGNTTITDPLTGQPVPTNQIPVNPVSAKILAALFPAPTDPTNLTLANSNFVTNFPGNYTLNNYDGRIDEVLNDHHSVFVRYTHKDITDVGNGGISTYNTALGPFSAVSTLRNLVASYNWVIRTNLINEARGGFTTANYDSTYPLAAQGDQLIQTFGLQGTPPPPKNGKGGIPDFQVAGLLGGDTNSFGRPRFVDNTTYAFADNLSWVKGTHTLKFGFDYRKIKYQDQITFTNGDEYGDYGFDGSITTAASASNAAHCAAQPTACAFIDFLYGLPVGTDFAQNGPDGKPFSYHYAWFAQDDWKIRHNLTINYGLRYELNPPFDDATNQLGQFDRNFPGGRLIVQGKEGMALVAPSWAQAVGNTPFVTNDQVGLPRTLRNTYYGNIQPRLGFTWNPKGDNRTVIRAAAGAYSVPVLGAVLYSLLGVDTSNFLKFVPTPGNTLQLPTPFGGSAATATCPPACPGYRRANQIDLKDPRVIQWNFSVEHDFGHDTVLRGSYIGSHTTQLIYSPDLNQLHVNKIGYAALTATPALRQQNLKFPNFAEVLTRDNGPSAKYHAITIEATRRFAKGLNFQSSYTFARNLSNALGSAPSSLIGQGGAGDNGPNTLDFFNIAGDYGDVNFTRRNRWLTTFFYELPFGRGKSFLGSAGRGLNALLGGWGVNGIFLLQSGPFLTPTFTGTDPSGTNPSLRSAGSFMRPDCSAGVPVNITQPTRDQWFNPSAFAVPGNDIGRFGNCKVGILHGPGTRTYSMTAGKQFDITERMKLRYEADFANLFNIVNFDVPNTRLGSSFGKVTATQPGEEAGPRSIQMSLRVLF
jgi:hypothetical protein